MILAHKQEGRTNETIMVMMMMVIIPIFHLQSQCSLDESEYYIFVLLNAFQISKKIISCFPQIFVQWSSLLPLGLVFWIQSLALL